MSEFIWYLIIALILTALGQLSFKLYSLRKGIWRLGLTILLFAGVPVFNYLALNGLSLDTVYMAASLTIILVMILSRIVLKEHISREQIFGSIIIAAGIVLYNLPG